MSELFGRTDFVTQELLEGRRFKAPADLLRHDEFSRHLLDRVQLLPPGSIVAVQGQWGRGKTDALARAAYTTYLSEFDRRFAKRALWLNPWQYGTPDLLTPLVLAILHRIPQERRSGKQGLLRAAKTVVKAGISFGMKTASVTLPGGALYGMAEGPVNTLLDGLFDSVDLQAKANQAPDVDPVYAMGKRFKELVDQLIESDERTEIDRALIFIDDLDRCLPHTQVALLEAISFLAASGAKATFIVALDPRITRQSLAVHYGVGSFDSDSYLDKMFQLRLTLPTLQPRAVRSVIAGLLDAEWPDGTGRKARFIFSDTLDENVASHLPGSAEKVLVPIAVKTPRVIKRVFERLCFFLQSLGKDKASELIGGSTRLEQLLSWLAISERWPEFREALQGSPDLADDFQIIHRSRDPDSRVVLRKATLRRIPSHLESPELSDMLATFINIGTGEPELRQIGQVLAAFEAALSECGL